MNGTEIKQRFALFNVKRWSEVELPPYLHTVPLPYEGTYSQEAIDNAVDHLRDCGSLVTPGAPAEGIIVYHVSSNTSFKVTLENDEMSKGEATALGLAA